MNKKHDVGIVGFWYGANYGSLLNGYAMYKTIKNFGKSVLMVHKPGYAQGDPELSSGHNIDFIRKYYPIEDISPNLPYDRLGELNQLCDTFCAGSDQIWNYPISFSENLYLPFVDSNKKIISFASSFGNITGNIPDDAKERLKTYFHRFDAISVREKFAVKLLREEFDTMATAIIEPVFLLDQNIYSDMAKESSFCPTEKYLLTYILDPTEAKRDAIMAYAKKMGLKVVNILDGKHYLANNDENNLKMHSFAYTIQNAHCEDFLSAFKNADFIITDSFHGTAFSIIFRKDFISIGNYHRGIERFADLLGRLGLMDRLIENPESIPVCSKYLEHIDYSHTEQLINAEKKDALDWLFSAVQPSPISKSIVAKLDIKEKCVGCGSCVNICPVDAIELKENKFGYYKATISKNKCIGCSKCSKVCPALELPDNNNFAPQAFAFVNKDQKSLMKSTSGGAFVALAKEVLNSGGVVYGVAYTNELYTIHKRIDSVDDLPLLQKSKYMQSFIGKDILRQVKLDICSGKKVLFSGCPCQIAGLKKYLGTEYDNLLLVDLFCTCNPSAKIMQKYIRENCNTQNGNITSFEFRHKNLNDTEWSGSTISYVSDGEEHYLKLDSTSFYSNLFILAPSHCEKCKYQGVPRQADISLGDAWGIANYDNSLDRRYGVSAVLVNSAKGQKLWNRLRKGEYIIKEEKVENICKYNGISFTKTRDWPTENYRELFYDNVLINGFNIAYRKAFAKFKETHNRIGVVSFGSCSCDTVRYSKNYDVLNAIQDNLFENIITSSVDLDKYDAFYNSASSANEKLNAYYNYDKPLCSKLFQKNAEYLILDLADERWRTLKLIDAKNNSHYLYYPFNNENEKYKSIIDKTNVLNGFKTMVFSLNQSDYMIIRERYKRAVDALLRHFNPSKIIVLDVRMAHQYLLNNGKLKTYNHEFWNIDAANEHLNKLYEILYELLPNSPRIKMPEYTIGQENHLFGASPLHFQDSYYEYVCTAINIIAGKDQTHTIQQLYNEQSLKNRINYDTITSQTKIEDLIRRIESIEKNIQ